MRVVEREAAVVPAPLTEAVAATTEAAETAEVTQVTDKWRATHDLLVFSFPDPAAHVVSAQRVGTLLHCELMYQGWLKLSVAAHGAGWVKEVSDKFGRLVQREAEESTFCAIELGSLLTDSCMLTASEVNLLCDVFAIEALFETSSTPEIFQTQLRVSSELWRQLNAQ